ncbi:glycoside hydrolase family 99-like domain-containing protein [Mesorhizobium sp. M8A.F.Ca.ET.165.01.1.1]|uniref:glycoside hydrolase family 99-like domain-containing protein n=1 Tax=Mesorhizobium sp. M8A.F.Ca.ET.165.01.1.1 TaxID=2563960 RepID=UPI001093BB5D|nr:glycoside hydrolase family 99-like domain-containing protein [Mesorhizobium sp. M8A.F.Ca.ET.165.01.1.1]TGT41340.1 glycosyltransferase [Mesorhizobium sp. M8A.F.Ca.ET.165.01.1.1]
MSKRPLPGRQAIGESGPSAGIEPKRVRARDRSLRDLYQAHSGKVSDKWSIYLETYDRVFAQYRGRPVRILEIGVQNGGSLEIWRQYFTKAGIVLGCDINVACGNLVFDDDKIAVIVGDANTDEIEDNITTISREFDIIIDDGSHTSSDIIRSFARYFPHLSEGGMYIAEDLHCSYWKEFEGGLYDPLSSMSFFKRLLDVVNHEHWGLNRSRMEALAIFAEKHKIAFDDAALASIHSVEFLNSLCIVTKQPIRENVLGPRRVQGRIAIADGSMIPLDGTENEAIDQAENPWSLKSVTMEQEIETNRELVERQGTQIEAFSSELTEMRKLVRDCEDELEQAKALIVARVQEAQILEKELSAMQEMTGVLLADREDARSEQARLHGVLDAVYASTSWQLTGPLRGLGNRARAIGKAPAGMRRIMARAAYRCWRNLPLPLGAKRKLKSTVFSRFPSLFGMTNAYRAWRSLETPDASPGGAGSQAVLFRSGPSLAPEPVYLPRIEAPPLLQKPVRVIAFYLPQFHPIPENDEWWGQGFTEWTNVRPAQPQFVGHHQPHVPDALGYYDLRDTAIQRQQIELAKLYGVEGFCFYFYWFGGKRLLETPLENWLEDKSLDMPFCLCWANENWSRRWDGMDQEILIGQDHSPRDDLAFIAEVAPYLRDSRYIRIDGKPLLLVYRPSLLPAAADTARRWRTWCRENGIGEIFLAYTQSFESVSPDRYGFDAAVEFPPNNSAPPNITHTVMPLHENFAATVYDWSVFLRRSENYPPRKYKLFRSVCPGWDNTARRKRGGTVFINNTPVLYRKWLDNAIRDTLAHVKEPSERLVFVNAWNEWAEGAHLEPDTANGYAYLQATRDALETAGGKCKPRIVIVSHDAHPHGAQLLALAMAREFGELQYDVDMIVLGDGPMMARFAEVASLHHIALDSEPPESVRRKLETIRTAGAEVAIVNTTVSGLIVPILKEAGFRTVSLVHELPGVLESYSLNRHAAAIAQHADKIVFAAPVVQSGFERFLGAPLRQALIRPQGLVRKNPFKGRSAEARRIVCSQHGFAPDTRYVLAVAFVDHRKGPDLFVEVAEEVLRSHPGTAFIWIGHFDQGMKETIEALLARKGLADSVKFVGFVQDPMAYYAGASVYALTSREDPFPNVVLESAEVGVPVVAFQEATGAADFIVENGGRLAKRLDVKDFAIQLKEVLDGPRRQDLATVGSIRRYLMDILHYATGFQRVSVVVPNYNYADHLLQRLRSIANQTYPIYELIVLDDASTDRSVETINSFRAEHSELGAELFINSQNSGSAFHQWAKGVGHSRGDLVWIAEADDFAEPRLLEELVPAFADPSLVLAYSQSGQLDGKGRVLAEDYIDYTRDISDDWLSDYTRDGQGEISEAMSVKNTIPNVSAVLFKRLAISKAIAEIGDELFSYRIAGDWLVYLRVLLQGKMRFRAKQLNWHRRHAQGVTQSELAERHLDEVRRVQEAARSLVSVSAETRRKADAWLQHVRTYLGVKGSDAA